MMRPLHSLQAAAHMVATLCQMSQVNPFLESGVLPLTLALATQTSFSLKCFTVNGHQRPSNDRTSAKSAAHCLSSPKGYAAPMA